MKNNKKSYIKTNIIGFLIAAIIVGGFVVYAATTFPSNDVSYDNSSSGLSSTNVKEALDELYKTCTQTPADQIIENGNLEKDEYECRYFFTGTNPNNYITFNNEQAGWRIISVECDGTIKIMRIDDIGNMAWDTDNRELWDRPSTLNTYLNETYYNTLSPTSQSKIVSHDWSIGAVSHNNNDIQSQINSENGTTWNGKIALISLSEYLRTNSNQSQCQTYTLNNSNSNTCKNTNWVFKNKNLWSLSRVLYLSNLINVVLYSNEIGTSNANSTLPYVYPTVYLSSSIKITGGDGSESNPYTIE